ncbi:MAG: acetyl-coenzyme A synthetase [Patescibacteria group bacterium]|nr:MAG: acetyl-coenzyme A synthetase [Patescibacteria group bacterium]
MNKTYNWEEKAANLEWFPDGNLNIAYSVLDKHLDLGNEDKTAFIFENDNGVVTKLSYGDLVRKTNQVANLLSSYVINKGDRIFLFLPRIPELYINFLGIIKTGAIAGTMFATFGTEALRDRLTNSKAKAIFTTYELAKRIEPIRSELPDLEHIFIIDSEEYQKEIKSQSDVYSVYHTRAEDYAFMLYTSGTTGKPKGIVHAHYGLIQQVESAKLVLDLKEDDIYWCTADPGWITGIVYGILANLSLGVTTFVYNGRFDPQKWYSFIDKYKITVWYTAPTAIRMLMAEGNELLKKYSLSSLRHLASVGEPLNPEAIIWSRSAFGGKYFHDTWWQTETGSIMIANTPNIPLKVGSMGKPLPWIVAEIVDDDGNIVPVGEEGNLAIRPPWPSMMRTVWQNQEKYDSYFKNGWYISGDRAWKDKDGYFWFIGRADDVIKTSGERVGPFEVESVLVGYEGVVEAGVIGKPDPIRGEIIKAFIVLKPGVKPTDELKLKLQEHVKQHLAGHAYPREIEFIDKLPKTKSGKIMRRILRAKELRQPIGDTSTLEEY